MKKIMIILIIIFSFAGLKAEDFDYGHCFCAHRHILSVSACSQFNFGKNWANGISIIVSPQALEQSWLSLSAQSSRLGSSLFSKDKNQDIITLGFSNNSIFRKISRPLYGTINIGYVNTEGEIKKEFYKTNLILAPEISFGEGATNISLGYNIFNSLNVNKNITPFYLKITISFKDVIYCENSQNYVNY